VALHTAPTTCFAQEFSRPGSGLSSILDGLRGAGGWLTRRERPPNTSAVGEQTSEMDLSQNGESAIRHPRIALSKERRRSRKRLRRHGWPGPSNHFDTPAARRSQSDA